MPMRALLSQLPHWSCCFICTNLQLFGPFVTMQKTNANDDVSAHRRRDAALGWWPRRCLELLSINSTQSNTNCFCWLSENVSRRPEGKNVLQSFSVEAALSHPPLLGYFQVPTLVIFICVYILTAEDLSLNRLCKGFTVSWRPQGSFPETFQTPPTSGCLERLPSSSFLQYSGSQNSPLYRWPMRAQTYRQYNSQ